MLFELQYFDLFYCIIQFSNSLQLHEPQHARLPCPSPVPGVYPNSCPLSQWCHPTTSSSVVPFSSHSQSFPTWGSFQMSQLFASGGQSIGVSALTSVLSMNTQDCNPLGWPLKKEQNFVICRNMDRPGGHYTTWNKSDKDKYSMLFLICEI